MISAPNRSTPNKCHDDHNCHEFWPRETQRDHGNVVSRRHHRNVVSRWHHGNVVSRWQYFFQFLLYTKHLKWTAIINCIHSIACSKVASWPERDNCCLFVSTSFLIRTHWTSGRAIPFLVGVTSCRSRGWNHLQKLTQRKPVVMEMKTLVEERVNSAFLRLD